MLYGGCLWINYSALYLRWVQIRWLGIHMKDLFDHLDKQTAIHVGEQHFSRWDVVNWLVNRRLLVVAISNRSGWRSGALWGYLNGMVLRPCMGTIKRRREWRSQYLKSLYSKSLHVCDLVLVFLTDRRNVWAAFNRYAGRVRFAKINGALRETRWTHPTNRFQVG